jgi:retron-type reverse transcriptase
VETVLFLILEPIYRVGFDVNSCGFSSSYTKRSVHSTLKFISTNYISERWVIEGDISKCLSNYQTLFNILKERIRDELIINLIKSSLNAKIYDSCKLWDPEVMGMRQEGKLYSLLCDIILDKLDKKVRE